MNSKCCVRDRRVGRTFCGSVVARTNTTCAGGSSSVFSSVFDAAAVSMCTSSMMYTLRRARRADAEVHALDELAHGVDAVVRRRVQLDQVEEGAVGDRDAVLADAVGLAVGLQVQAVEGSGQDPGGRGLAGATGAGEEVGVADAVVPDRAAAARLVTCSWPTNSENFCGRYLRYRLCDATEGTLPMPTSLGSGPLAPYRVRRDERP